MPDEYAPLRETVGAHWRRLHALVDDATPALRRAFLAAVASLRADLPMADLEAALEAHATDRVEALVPFDTFEQAMRAMGPQLDVLATAGAQDAVDRLPPAAQGAISFTLISPAVLAVAHQQAADLVREVTEETRRALRAIVADGYARGLHPRQQAKEIRQLVGLTTRQQAAVAAYRQSLLDDGFTTAVAEKRAATYAQKLLTYRANLIAKTEAALAANEGQRAAWQALVAHGLLSPEQFEREWIAIVRGACPICAALDGKRAPLLGGSYPDGSVGPPEHPACRCTEGLAAKSPALAPAAAS